jgi:hypothetical protein
MVTQPQTSTQERFLAALDTLVEQLERDRYVLAAILYGSLARGEAWEKSDVDLTIILQDGVGRVTPFRWLTVDDVSFSAVVTTRSRHKRAMEGALQGSFLHSIRSECRLLFSKDDSIAAWLEESDRINARDREFQLLSATADVVPMLDKAEKWLVVKDDPAYSFVWLLYVVNNLARVEVVLNGRAPGREVIHQALEFNSDFFHSVYTDLIDGPKDRQTIRQALDAIDGYLEERAEELFGPLLGYLAGADGMRTASEIGAHFEKKVQREDLYWMCEWLARKGIIEKVAAPVRLTKKSQVALEEPAFVYEDVSDWE